MAGGCGVGCGSGFMFEFDELVLMSLAALPSAFCVCKSSGCPHLYHPFLTLMTFSLQTKCDVM